MAGYWLRPGAGAGAVVFLHGVLSSSEKCFRHPNGTYWPQLLADEPDHLDIGIYSYDYHTGIYSGSFGVRDAADSVRDSLLIDGVLSRKRLLFVCHSMGGLVARKFAVANQSDLLKRQLALGFFLLGSPSLGSPWANIISALTFFFPHQQRNELRWASDGSMSAELDKDFMNLREASGIPVRGVELIEHKLSDGWFLGLLPRIVPSTSAGRYFAESTKIAGSSHSSIAKPDSREAQQHVKLRRFVDDFFATDVGQPVAPERRQTGEPEYLSGAPTYPVTPSDGRKLVGTHFVDRPRLRQALLHFLSSNEDGRRLHVLLGKPCTGKSTLLRRIYAESNLKKIWIDASVVYTKPPALEDCELLIIDHLVLEHPVLQLGWIELGAVPTIVATSDEAVKRECLSLAGLAASTDAVTVCKEFSEDETTVYVKQACGQLSIEACSTLHRLTHGNPMVLGLCRALLLELQSMQNLSEVFSEVSSKDVARIGLDHWLSLRPTNRNALRGTLSCLACVPFFGMRAATLRTVLGITLEEVALSLHTLTLYSFVETVRIDDSENFLYFVPTGLRASLTATNSTQTDTWRASYKKVILGGDPKLLSAVELLDAWIVGWESLFNKASLADFESFERKFNSIILEAEKQQGIAPLVEAYLTSLLLKRHETLEAAPCPETIGFAHFLRSSIKASRMAATAIWPGAYNGDAWARAASIMCATEHWSQLGTSAKLVGGQKLAEWWNFALDRASSQKHLDPESRAWGSSFDLDFCSATIASIRLQGIDAAIALLDRADYRAVYPCLTLAHVACMYYLCHSIETGGARYGEQLAGIAAIPIEYDNRFVVECLWLINAAYGRDPRFPELSLLEDVDGDELSGHIAMVARSICDRTGATSLGKLLSEKFPKALAMF